MSIYSEVAPSPSVRLLPNRSVLAKSHRSKFAQMPIPDSSPNAQLFCVDNPRRGDSFKAVRRGAGRPDLFGSPVVAQLFAPIEVVHRPAR